MIYATKLDRKLDAWARILRAASYSHHHSAHAQQQANPLQQAMRRRRPSVGWYSPPRAQTVQFLAARPTAHSSVRAPSQCLKVM